jgi:hypothetical protein
VFWDEMRSTGSVPAASRVAGVSSTLGRRWFAAVGGITPVRARPSRRYLTALDRETIYLGLVLGSSYAEIARSIGRPTSTVTRELDAYPRNPKHARAVGFGRRRGRFGKVPATGELLTLDRAATLRAEPTPHR